MENPRSRETEDYDDVKRPGSRRTTTKSPRPESVSPLLSVDTIPKALSYIVDSRNPRPVLQETPLLDIPDPVVPFEPTEEDEEYEEITTVSPRDIPKADSTFIVHGNWCGPGWTGGQKVTASDYASHGGDWDFQAIDALDAACRSHDLGCSDGGCDASDDVKLSKDALVSMADPRVPNATALLVSGGMAVSSLTQREDSPLPLTPLPLSNPTPGVPTFGPDGVESKEFDVNLPSIPEPLQKLGGHFIKYTTKLGQLVKNSPRIATAARLTKFIPVLGSAIDAHEIYSEIQEGESGNPGAATADFVTNLFPPLAIANDIYAVATDSDGFWQDMFGDVD